MKGIGTLIFLAVFFLSLLATLAVPVIPPGKQIYAALGAPELEVAGTDYPILGFSATLLIYAFFNGVVYGMMALLLFTIGSMTRQRKSQSLDQTRSSPLRESFCPRCGARHSSRAVYCKNCGNRL